MSEASEHTMNNPDHTAVANPEPPPMPKEKQMDTPAAGKVFDDPIDPKTWPLMRKLYLSSVAYLYAFVLLFGATSYSTALPLFPKVHPKITQEQGITSYSLYIFGILFAPLVTPHLSETFGRRPTYIGCTILMAVFSLGTSQSKTFSQFAGTRFFAGFFGGPMAILIEGSFADLWPACFTGTYYIILQSALFWGAIVGAVSGLEVLALTGNVKYPVYLHLLLALLALVWGAGARETFPRAIIRTRARRMGQPHNLEPAATGSTIPDMLTNTFVRPAIMLVTDPIVIGLSLFASLNFGIIFEAFTTLPPVLLSLGLTVVEGGEAFTTGVAAVGLAVIFNTIIDQLSVRFYMKRGNVGQVEYRLIPAILGSTFQFIALFWVGWTLNANHKPGVPVAGVGFFIWGALMAISGTVSYLFDVYGPTQSLSALTAVAVTRILTGGWFPIYIFPAVKSLGGSPKWLFGAWGIIQIVFTFIPLAIFLLGARWRMKSRYGGADMTNYVMAEEERPRNEANGAATA